MSAAEVLAGRLCTWNGDAFCADCLEDAQRVLELTKDTE